MPTETDDFIGEEHATEFDQFDGSIEGGPSPENQESGIFGSSSDIHETIGASEPQEFIEPGKQAVLEQKGGEARDWELEYKGDSGYWFDGQEVRDPDGNAWTNEDVALHQGMLAQWKDGGNTVFFLPDYREQTEEGEILYVTQLILGEKGGVTYEIHKHETRYPKDEEVGEKIEEHAEAHTASRSEIMGYFRDADERGRTADTLISVDKAEGLTVDNSEPVKISYEQIHGDIVPSISTEGTESTFDDFMPEVPTMVGNGENAEQNASPDAWLVELLKIDPLESADMYDNTVPESDTPQEAIQEDVFKETVDPRTTLGSETTAKFGNEPPVLTTHERDEGQTIHEPESTFKSDHLVAIEIASHQKTVDSQPDTREMRENAIIGYSKNPAEIVSRESIADQFISTTMTERSLKATFSDSEPKASEGEGRASAAEKYTSPDTLPADVFKTDPLELQNLSAVLHQAGNVTMHENIRDATQHAEDKNESISMSANKTENEQSVPLQRADIIMRAIGVPISAPRTARIPELLGSKGIPSMQRAFTASRHHRARTTRPGSSAGSRISRNGVIMEMAA